MGDLVQSDCVIRLVRQTGPKNAEAIGDCRPKNQPNFSWPYEFTFEVVDGEVAAVDRRPFEM